MFGIQQTHTLVFLYFRQKYTPYHWYRHMRLPDTSSGCRSMAPSYQSDHELAGCTPIFRNTMHWGYEVRQHNIPGIADLATWAQIPALSSHTDRSSSDRSEHSASRWRHCHGNAARSLRRRNIQQPVHLQRYKLFILLASRADIVRSR